MAKANGGSVFYVYSEKVNGKKETANKDVIDEIKKEIGKNFGRL